MIRIISIKVTKPINSAVAIASTPKFQIRYISTQKQNRKVLFEELFPMATKIDPTSNSLFALEPIEGTNVEGTIFTNKSDNLKNFFSSPSSTSPRKSNKTPTTEEQVEHLVRDDQHKFELLDMFEYDNEYDGMGEGSSLLNDTFSLEEYDERFEVKKFTPFAKLDEYIEHYSKHHEKPNHMSFIITNTQDASFEDTLEGICRQIDIPFGSIIIEKGLDRTSVSKTTSSFISLTLNSDLDDLTVDRELYYNRFANFGCTINGIRHGVVKAGGLKTIEIKINDQVNEAELKQEFVKVFTDIVKDVNQVKISMSEPIYDPFQLVVPLHRGTANITLKSHIDALKAIEVFKNFSLKGTKANPNLSRYIFADNSDSSLLIKFLEKKKSKQSQEIQLMRKMIDIKEKVRLIESRLEKLNNKRTKSKSKSNNINNNNNNKSNSNSNNSFKNNNINNSSDAIEDNNNNFLKMTI